METGWSTLLKNASRPAFFRPQTADPPGLDAAAAGLRSPVDPLAGDAAAGRRLRPHPRLSGRTQTLATIAANLHRLRRRPGLDAAPVGGRDLEPPAGAGPGRRPGRFSRVLRRPRLPRARRRRQPLRDAPDRGQRSGVRLRRPPRDRPPSRRHGPVPPRHGAAVRSSTGVRDRQRTAASGRHAGRVAGPHAAVGGRGVPALRPASAAARRRSRVFDAGRRRPHAAGGTERSGRVRALRRAFRSRPAGLAVAAGEAGPAAAEPATDRDRNRTARRAERLYRTCIYWRTRRRRTSPTRGRRSRTAGGGAWRSSFGPPSRRCNRGRCGAGTRCGRCAKRNG